MTVATDGATSFKGLQCRPRSSCQLYLHSAAPLDAIIKEFCYHIFSGFLTEQSLNNWHPVGANPLGILYWPLPKVHRKITVRDMNCWQLRAHNGPRRRPWIVLQMPHFSLGVDAPLFVSGSREGGRLFKYQLEPPLWIIFDGHEASDDVIMALGGKSGNRSVPKKMKRKQTIGTHRKVAKLLEGS